MEARGTVLASSKQEGPADHSLLCCGPGLASDPPPCSGPGTSGLGEGPELISHRVKPALQPSTCQNFSEKWGGREDQAIAQGDLNKNGHGTCVCKKEKLDTTDMSSFYIPDKEILVYPSWWIFTSDSEKK